MAQAVNPVTNNRNVKLINDVSGDRHFCIDLTDGYAWGDVHKSDDQLDKIFEQFGVSPRPTGYLAYTEDVSGVDVHDRKLDLSGERIGLPNSVSAEAGGGYIGDSAPAGAPDVDSIQKAFRDSAEAASADARARAEETAGRAAE